MSPHLPRQAPAGLSAALPALHRALILVLALGASACATASPPAMTGQEMHPLQIRQEGFMRAMAERDPAVVSEFFADDAVMHVAGMPAIRGRPAIRAFYENVFRFLSASEAIVGEMRESDSRDLAYVTGESRNRFVSPGGSQEFAGKFAMVWERKAGAWMVVLYTLSNDSGGPGS